MHIVTLPRLTRALSTVIGELTHFGFYDDKLDKVEVELVPFGAAWGWSESGDEPTIGIPEISLKRLAQLIGFERCGLCDLLRHEYGHALEGTHRGLFRSSVFSDAFDDSIDSDQEYEFDPEYFVTEYAAKKTDESFAECFMFFLKYKGKLPSRFDAAPIRRQWHFIKRLATTIKQGKSRW